MPMIAAVYDACRLPLCLLLCWLPLAAAATFADACFHAIAAAAMPLLPLLPPYCLLL